jgi:hypothetical protein
MARNVVTQPDSADFFVQDVIENRLVRPELVRDGTSRCWRYAGRTGQYGWSRTCLRSLGEKDVDVEVTVKGLGPTSEGVSCRPGDGASGPNLT